MRSTELRVVKPDDVTSVEGREGVGPTKATPKGSVDRERSQVLTGRMLRRALETARVSEEAAARVLGISQQQVSRRIHGERRFGTDELYRLAEHPRTRCAASAFVDQLSVLFDQDNPVVTSPRSLESEICRLTEKLGEVARRHREATCPSSPDGELESYEESVRIDQSLNALASRVSSILRARQRERAAREASQSQ